MLRTEGAAVVLLSSLTIAPSVSDRYAHYGLRSALLFLHRMPSITCQHSYKEAASRWEDANVSQTHNEYTHQRLCDSDDQHIHSPSVPEAVESDKAGTSSTTEFVPAIYTCPMRPEIRQDHPGTCPKCGMTLEPVMPAVEEEENVELADSRWRFWASFPLTVTVFVLAMAGHQLTRLDPVWQDRFGLALATPIVLWTGLSFFGWCVQFFVYRSPNMWTLTDLGTGAAYLYSTAVVAAPGVFLSTFAASGRVRVYLGATAIIISLTLLGQMLELKARS